MEQPIEQRESPYEIVRRIENLVRFGTIEEVRHTKPARCRVRTGNLVTNWLPWSAERAAGKGGSKWWPPKKGEQCMLFAPGGDLLNALVMPCAYSDSNPQTSEDPNACRTDWSENEYMEHNSETGVLTIACASTIRFLVGGSSLTITGSSIELIANGGRLRVDSRGATGWPDVIAKGVSLFEHLHSNVMPGPSSSGPPIPGSDVDSGMGGGGAGGSTTPSHPGDPASGTIDQGIPADATGIYKWAVWTRLNYDPTQSPAITGGPTYAGYQVWRNIPHDPSVITPEVFYERVRPAMDGNSDGKHLALVSQYDQATGTFSDDVIDMQIPAGIYKGAIPAGIKEYAVEAPFDLYQAESGEHYALYTYNTIHMASRERGGRGITYRRPIFWQLTGEEVAADAEFREATA